MSLFSQVILNVDASLCLSPKTEAIIEHIQKEFRCDWHGLISEEKADERLKNQKRGSYLFRMDPNGFVYLSGVNAEGEIHHAKIKRIFTMWFGLNAGNYSAMKLGTLIARFLHCEESKICSIKS